jgi:hypothetical protein
MRQEVIKLMNQWIITFFDKKGIVLSNNSKRLIIYSSIMSEFN